MALCCLPCCNTTVGCEGCQTCQRASNVRPEAMPYICPVCRGNGLVDNGFYTQTTGQWTSTSTTPEPCRACAGKGVLWNP